MTSLFIALLLLLRLLPGAAEAADDEELSEFLYDYASRFGDYLYATVEYYSDNTTLIPTMYPDELSGPQVHPNPTVQLGTQWEDVAALPHLFPSLRSREQRTEQTPVTALAATPPLSAPSRLHGPGFQPTAATETSSERRGALE